MVGGEHLVSQNANWIALNALLTEALDSSCCAADAPSDERSRHDLAVALTDHLCRDVVVKDLASPRRARRLFSRR